MLVSRSQTLNILPALDQSINLGYKAHVNVYICPCPRHLFFIDLGGQARVAVGPKVSSNDVPPFPRLGLSSYLQYSAICARLLRRTLKPELRAAALQKEQSVLKAYKWKDGVQGTAGRKLLVKVPQWTLFRWGSKVSTNWSNTWKHACYCAYRKTCMFPCNFSI